MINTIWWNGLRGNWDCGLLCETLNKFPDFFIQHNKPTPPLGIDKCIMVVVGKPDPKPLHEYLSLRSESLVILISDEDAYFDWEAAIPKQHTIITQYWNPEYKNKIQRRILLGCPTRIKDFTINKTETKEYEWSFVGQVQNQFRQECVDVLAALPTGFLHTVPQFGGGEGAKDYQEYLDIMCKSKFVICPSGSMTADCFRIYEAMECGAIPIVNKRSPRDKEGFDYWQSIYPLSNLISVNNWKELPDILSAYKKENADILNYWWFQYKSELESKLVAYAKGNSQW